LLGVQHERLYRLLGKPVVGSSGFLDLKSVLVSESEYDAQKSELILRTQAFSITIRGLNWYEVTHLDAHESEETPRSMHWMEISPNKSLVQVAEGYSSSEGA
jgi:hypothetical protein